MQSKQRKTRIGRNSALRPVFRRVASLLATVAALLAGPAAAETLNGRAVIATRMALPPGLTFEAIIEDISRAGAPAEDRAGIHIEQPCQPPRGSAVEKDRAGQEPRAV